MRGQNIRGRNIRKLIAINFKDISSLINQMPIRGKAMKRVHMSRRILNVNVLLIIKWKIRNTLVSGIILFY